VIERLLHEPGKWDRTVALEMVPDEIDERQGSWHGSSGMFDNGKFGWIVNVNPRDQARMVCLKFPFDPGGSP